MADTPAISDVQVTHDPARSRFVVELDGKVAEAAYHRDGREVHFTHTEVPPEFEGRGIGSRLARTALDWAVGERLAIVPQCPFIREYVQRHEAEYGEHVAREWRGRLEG
jgi:predicted GNAT family acetyltransferase